MVSNSTILDPDPKEIPPWCLFGWPESEWAKLTQWTDLAKASKKERSLVDQSQWFSMKLHGGREALVIGDDVSGDEWGETISNALNHYPSPICIIQEFMKPRSFTHPVFLNEDKKYQMKQDGFVCRLIFTFDKKAKWSGTLATFCPADKKKIIHGMKDGSLMPCKRI